ncbi:MAG: pyridoxamine 5'-phosphate oxidase, partial [Rubrivivax sp.]|nr:pyridoxamine 5'-phosphate oxidase [Rubrivivax sp.]
ARSAKVAQIRAHPEGTLVLWSRSLGWQLRLRVTLDIETEGLLVSSAWAQLKMTPAAQDYLSPLPPGSALGQALPERDSRGHFAIVSARVQAIDWLELHADGHRRARFDAQGARWLTP